MNPEIQEEKQVSWSVIAIIIVAVLAVAVWLLVDTPETPEPLPVVIQEEVIVEEEPVELEPLPMVEDTPELVDTMPEPVVELPKLPDLNSSDSLVIEKLPDITWRKELLKLLVTEDLIRRFVVFTDNFAQGSLSYDHSPFIVPVERFFANEVSNDEQSNQASWQWDESSARRFSLYVDLLRSMDSGELVSFYYEIKPLIDQAYQELGYPEEDFTQVLQASIIRVLDMQMPEHVPQLTRPSVMYKFQDEELEGLDDADKLLLRIGKENILVIKSVLLEINDKLSRANNG